MKLFSILILIICLALNANSRKLCGTANCRQAPTPSLSPQCSDYHSFIYCKSNSCGWSFELNKCLPQSCDRREHTECIYNFNCKWNWKAKTCHVRNFIYKRR